MFTAVMQFSLELLKTDASLSRTVDLQCTFSSESFITVVSVVV